LSADHRPVSQRPVVIAVIGCLAVLLLAGYLASITTAVTVPDAGGTYVEGIAGRPQALNPLLCQTNPAERDLVALVFNGLTRRNERGEVVPDLAERWEVSEDGRTYTFHLRKRVKWHDGTAFGADDVVATLQALQDPAYPGVAWLANLWRQVAVERLDALTVRVTLPEPYAPFLSCTTIGLLPARFLASTAAQDLATSPFNDHPVGTGPWQVLETSAAAVLLEPNPHYYGPKPRVGRLQFRFYPDFQAARVALEQGEVLGFGARWLPSQSLSALQANPNIALYTTPLAGCSLIYLNLKLPYFQDRLVRQALLLALNRPQLIAQALGGQGLVADSPLVALSWAYDRQVKHYGYDPAQAKALLDKAGWREDGRGGRVKDGVPLEFTLLTDEEPAHQQLAAAASRAWQAVGARVETQAVSGFSLLHDYLQPRRFEALLHTWGDLSSDPDPYEMWHSSQAGEEGQNFAGWQNMKADEWLEVARQSGDPEERAGLYQQFQALFAEEVPSLLLYSPLYTYAINKQVKDVKVGPLWDPSERFRYLDQWYIKTKKVLSTEKTKLR
jgi:peptide/nickel transport system substrate-binding protein